MLICCLGYFCLFDLQDHGACLELISCRTGFRIALAFGSLEWKICGHGR
jgi:hypothetical protein